MRFDPSQTVLAGVPRVTLQANLAAAQSAYNQIMLGAKEVSVSYEGKSVTYTASDPEKLEDYIALLQRQLGINRGRQALTPIFVR